MQTIDKNLNDVLKVDRESMSSKVAGTKRLDRVSEAINWKGGNDGNLNFYTIFSEGDYFVNLGKPGKEAAPDYNRCKYHDGRSGNNPNDMKPTIFEKDVLQDKQIASFVDIFNELQKLGKENEQALEIIACLLFRSAYMIDHKEVSPKIWRYEIPDMAMKIIEEKIPTVNGMPIKVFLNFLDALAWNEDVKYHTLGFDIRLGTGRRNNLLTCVNLIGVLLNKIPIAKFAGNFSRPPAGISAISNKEALEIFPYLR
jgi:hypothetical protein